LKKVAVFLATWCYSGLIPPVLVKGIAGTYGSLAALPLCYLALKAGQSANCLYILILIAVFLIGYWCVPLAEFELGPMIDWGGKIRSTDQNQIVIDEVLGMLISCAPLIWLKTIPLFWELLIAFILFRMFDALKPWPVSYFDRQKNHIGVMLDDAGAGLYAAVGLILTLQVFK